MFWKLIKKVYKKELAKEKQKNVDECFDNIRKDKQEDRVALYKSFGCGPLIFFKRSTLEVYVGWIEEVLDGPLELAEHGVKVKIFDFISDAIQYYSGTDIFHYDENILKRLCEMDIDTLMLLENRPLYDANSYLRHIKSFEEIKQLIIEHGFDNIFNNLFNLTLKKKEKQKYQSLNKE